MMRRLRFIPIIFGLTVCLLSAGCNKGKELSLHDRIVAAATSKYCSVSDGCFNPVVQAVDAGFDVTMYLGSEPQHAHVLPTDLAKYLQTLPMQAWPRGPSITVTLTDIPRDSDAVERNFAGAQQICRKMGLDLQIVPGG
jgi:hypothetical protein